MSPSNQHILNLKKDIEEKEKFKGTQSVAKISMKGGIIENHPNAEVMQHSRKSSLAQVAQGPDEAGKIPEGSKEDTNQIPDEKLDNLNINVDL